MLLYPQYPYPVCIYIALTIHIYACMYVYVYSMCTFCVVLVTIVTSCNVTTKGSYDTRRCGAKCGWLCWQCRARDAEYYTGRPSIGIPQASMSSVGWYLHTQQHCLVNIMSLCMVHECMYAYHVESISIIVTHYENM